MTNMKRAFCIALAAGLTLGAGSGLAVTATSFCGDFINSDGNICVATELLSMDLTGKITIQQDRSSSHPYDHPWNLLPAEEQCPRNTASA